MRNIKLLCCCLRQLLRHHQLSFTCTIPPQLHLLRQPCALRVLRGMRASVMARPTYQRGVSFPYHPTTHEITCSILERLHSLFGPRASARTSSHAPMRHWSRFRRHRTARCGFARSYVTVPRTRISAHRENLEVLRLGVPGWCYYARANRQDEIGWRNLTEYSCIQGLVRALYTPLFHPFHVFAFQLSLRCLVDILCRDLVPL